jgi:hypothetical protein
MHHRDKKGDPILCGHAAILPVPVIGAWFGELNAPGGIMLPEFYNQLVAMHGTP